MNPTNDSITHGKHMDAFLAGCVQRKADPRPDGSTRPYEYTPGDDEPPLRPVVHGPHGYLDDDVLQIRRQRWTEGKSAEQAAREADANLVTGVEDKKSPNLQIFPAPAAEVDLYRTSGSSPPYAQDGIPLMLSTVANVKAGTSIKKHSKTWGQLAGILASPKEHISKDSCPLFKLVTFGETRNAKGSLRHNQNVVEVYGLVGDYDAEAVSVEEAATRLEGAGVEAFMYTTASHTTERPRWRIVAPLSKPHTPAEYAALMDKLNGALGGILAPESWTLSQVFYYGRVRGVPYESRRTVGKYIDLVEIIPVGKRQELTGAKSAASDGEGSLDEFDLAVIPYEATDDLIGNLRSALSAMESDDRDLWVKIAHGLHCLEDSGYELWIEWSKRSDKFDAADADRVWESCAGARSNYKAVFAEAQRRGWVNPKSAEGRQLDYASLEDRTDVGNANLLVRLTDGNLRFVPERQLWLWWDGQGWHEDTHGSLAHGAALRVAEHYYRKRLELEVQAADGALDPSERGRIQTTAKSLGKWEKHCRNKRVIDAMLSTAALLPHVQVTVAALNKDPYLLGVQNGVVDLRTGKLRLAAREDFVTKRCAAAYNPRATAPRWEEFIVEITGSPLPVEFDISGEIIPTSVGRFKKRSELSAYLQRALGYSITGLTSEHKMFFAFGAGANGKNVTLDTIQPLMGDYWATIAPEALMATKHDVDAERPTPTAASLAGARAGISSETKDGQRLDVALVKRHTGGGFMTARHLRENTFRFEITHKLWMMTNHRPALDHLDDALRGRLHLIPFDRQWNRPGHPERDPALPDGDKNLMQALKDESEGILAWLVAGAVAYFKHGLEPPREVVQSTQDYFQEQDLMGRWLTRYERIDPREGEQASALFDAFQQWCHEEEGVAKPDTQKAFSTELTRRGVLKRRDERGVHFGLRPTASSADPA